MGYDPDHYQLVKIHLIVIRKRTRYTLQKIRRNHSAGFRAVVVHENMNKPTRPVGLLASADVTKLCVATGIGCCV